MTRHLTSSADTPIDAARESAGAALLRPLRPQRNLADEVVDRIAAEIRSGRLPPGTQLPTEAALMRAMSVSRTVVREAVAALRADGLVVTRQGLGAFVAAEAGRSAFRIAGRPEAGETAISEVLRVMELRLAVEVEAAVLAASRASAAQIAIVRERLRAIDKAIAAGETAVTEDFAFHCAIAEATGNPHFSDFLSFLGRHVIPRQVVRANQGSREERKAYLEIIQRDHERIYKAIRTHDPRGARTAMRAHLSKSIERYRTFAVAVRAR